MFGWIAKLFKSVDRQQAAAERAALAWEDIAADVEAMRNELRSRLGIEAPVAVRPIAAKDDAEHEAGAPKRGRGK